MYVPIEEFLPNSLLCSMDDEARSKIIVDKKTPQAIIDKKAANSTIASSHLFLTLTFLLSKPVPKKDSGMNIAPNIKPTRYPIM